MPRHTGPDGSGEILVRAAWCHPCLLYTSPESGEEFVIFDGGRHGYDNLFCDEQDPAELEHRPLKRYEIPASKLVLELGYSIDYEDEKEDFEPDEADTVELITGERMPWEQVKRDGIDYIALYYVNEKGKQVQILDAELA